MSNQDKALLCAIGGMFLCACGMVFILWSQHIL